MSRTWIISNAGHLQTVRITALTAMLNAQEDTLLKVLLPGTKFSDNQDFLPWTLSTLIRPQIASLPDWQSMRPQLIALRAMINPGAGVEKGAATPVHVEHVEVDEGDLRQEGLAQGGGNAGVCGQDVLHVAHHVNLLQDVGLCGRLRHYLPPRQVGRRHQLSL